VPKLREWQRIAAAIAQNKNAAKALLRYSEIQWGIRSKANAIPF
jgi:hypothetical protein